jgi:hypothetical protein
MTLAALMMQHTSAPGQGSTALAWSCAENHVTRRPSVAVLQEVAAWLKVKNWELKR